VQLIVAKMANGIRIDTICYFKCSIRCKFSYVAGFGEVLFGLFSILDLFHRPNISVLASCT
jgi:hypothetical protein